MFRGFLFPRRRTVESSGNQFVSHRLFTTRAKQLFTEGSGRILQEKKL